MLRFRTLPPIAVVGSALLCAAGSAQALGYGRVVNVSTLGQPLNFAATVRLDADETLLRECVAVEVLAGDSRLPPAALRISLEPGSDGNERQIRVSTLTQIDEPVVTVNVTAGCQARLTRSFVMLVDPPGINLAQGGEAPPASLPPQRVDSTVAPVVSVVEAAAAASSPPAAAPRRAAAPSRSRAAVAASAAPVRTTRAAGDAERPRERKPPAPRVAAARREGSRLQLEAAAPAVASAASAARPGDPGLVAAAAALAASAALDQAAAVAVAASAASAAQAAQHRLAAVEENMAKLREEQQATQKALLQLQASLEQAQATRYSNPMVYGLALLSALLAVLVAALWWRQSQTRHASQWWLAPAAGPVPPRPPLPRRPAADAAGAAGRQETQPAVMDERAVVRTLDELPPPAPPPAAPQPVEPPRPAAPPVVLVDPPVLRRELSVEELIDLEQQADFFVVLGQDDAAIDLLMGHVRSSGGASPLPYLKLLEIYRRRGEREAYERIRERFNRRFSAYAPDWDADLMQGKSLDDYPRVLAQLQRLWDEPSRVTAMLDAALMRQDGSAETFDLPAYRELLFLYSIARDLGEHPAKAGAVDLLLPIDGEVPEQPIEKLTASRLLGFAETNQLTVAVDLDVTSALPAPLPGKGFSGLVDPRLKGDGSSF